jgi:hypothetical protein
VTLQPGGSIVGNQPIVIENRVDVTGLVSTIMTEVDAKIVGAFGSLKSAFSSGIRIAAAVSTDALLSQLLTLAGFSTNDR